MSRPPPAGPGAPVGVVSAVAGPTESIVAASLSGRRELALVRRCADVAELLSVTEAGLAVVAVVSESFPDLDGDVVDRVRLHGCAVLGVVDPDRESSERLRAWGVTVVELHPEQSPPGPQTTTEEVLAAAVLSARRATRPDAGAGGYSASGPAASGPAGSGPAGSGPVGSGGATPAVPTPSAPDPATEPSPVDGRTPDGRTLDGRANTHADVPGPGSRGRGPHGSARTAARVGADDGSDGGNGPEVRARPGATTSTPGRMVAVWGPAGAPGRTTVAVGVAAELAESGAQVLLVDADTYAASVAQVLGMLDESPGLVAAVRAGLDGRLDPELLARLAPTVAPGLRVLTGLTRAARWSELRPAGLQAVWSSARRLVDHVVVDLAPPLEEDDELSYDTAAPRRNGAALDVLRAADDVLVVGSADPVGLQRLVRGLQDLAAAVPGVAPQVVVNRVRADAVGRNPRLRVREALDRFAGVRDLRLVPDDRRATDRALLAGRTLVEVAADSPARLALRATAAGLAAPAGSGPPAAGAVAGAVGTGHRGLLGRRAGRRRATRG